MPANESTQLDVTGEGANAPAPWVGRLLAGKWRIDRLISTGGMSLVYSATHRNGKRVAIKALRPELCADTRARRRFLREAYLVNRVPHDGVVPILDDEEAERVFLVMELLEGATLEELTRDVACEAAEATYVIERLLDILAAAHEVGILHRDVKPSNVFVTRKGRVRLLDFGIARHRLDAAENLTRDGAVLGTPGFMAPEQARGRWDDVDERTDLWAVGATLFRLLTGRRVHEAATVQEYMVAAATEPAPPLASVRADIPAPLAEFVDKALRFDPGDRWQSAREMLDAVAPIRQKLGSLRWHALRLPEAKEATTHDESRELPVLVRSAEKSEPHGGHARRAPWAWVSVGVVLGVALGWLAFSSPDVVKEPPIARPHVAAAAPARAPDPAPTGEAERGKSRHVAVVPPGLRASRPTSVSNASVRAERASAAPGRHRAPAEPPRADRAPAETPAAPVSAGPSSVAPLEQFLQERQ